MPRKLKLVPTAPAVDVGLSGDGLGSVGKALLDRIQAEYAIADSGSTELLMQACHAADRAAECAAQIRADGLMLRSGSTWKDNPMLRHELQFRALVCRCLARLGIVDEPTGAHGSPYKKYGP